MSGKIFVDSFQEGKLEEGWRDNKKVLRQHVSSGVLISRDQPEGTPGLLKKVKLSPGRYKFSVHGAANCKASLFVSRLRLDDIITKGTIHLSSAALTTQSIEFDVPDDNFITVGVLLSASKSPLDAWGNDQFILQSASITRVEPENGVFAGLASIPSREKSLESVLHSIYDQFDNIFVHLNNYEKIPDFLVDSKITISKSQEIGDLKDTGKFVGLRYVGRNSYYFSLDDDIIYPKSYRARMISALEKYDNRVLLGVHAAIYRKEHASFFSRFMLHFKKALGFDFPVSVLGTGTTAFHTKTVYPELNWFKVHGMADLTVARRLNEQKIPRIAIARGSQWLYTPDELSDETETLFEATKLSEVSHNALLQDNVSWGLSEIESCLDATFGADWRSLFEAPVNQCFEHLSWMDNPDPTKVPTLTDFAGARDISTAFNMPHLLAVSAMDELKDSILKANKK